LASIKSLARIDIAWVEEAAPVSKKSWIGLPPSIRGRHETDPNGMGGPFGLGPEIIITFNPELDTDETYKRFVLQRDKYAPDFIKSDLTGEMERYSFCIKINHSDNPLLPKDLRQEMEVLKAADEDEWLHVWEGFTRQTITGAVYEKEIKKVMLEGRRGKVNYDPSRPVHTFWDLGHDDKTAIWFIQQVGVEYNLINYFEDRLQKIQYYLEYLQNLKYVYGYHYLPHDGDNETLASKSVANLVRATYPKRVIVVPRVPQKIVGIRAARQIFDLCNFDEENTQDGWQCLCRYQWKVNEDTGQFSQQPLHNDYSNGADGFQTFALSLKSETASKKKKVDPDEGRIINGGIIKNRSWMGSL
jgi:phage terminase large subunit